jgi:hypothetical protein
MADLASLLCANDMGIISHSQALEMIISTRLLARNQVSERCTIAVFNPFL